MGKPSRNWKKWRLTGPIINTGSFTTFQMIASKEGMGTVGHKKVATLDTEVAQRKSGGQGGSLELVLS